MSKKIQVKLFSIPLCGDRELEEELNRFLQTRQIITLDKGLADQAWNFCITYVGTSEDLPLKGVKSTNETSNGMKDYKKILTSEQFSLYLRLHSLRNQLSEELRLPKGGIFRNDELAQMSISRCSTINEIQKIPGVGEKKAQKFGEGFLRLIAEFNEEEAKETTTEQDESFVGVQDSPDALSEQGETEQ